MYVTYIAFTFSKTIPNDTHWFSLPHFQTTYQGQIYISCSCKAEFGPHSITLCIAKIFLTVKPCQNKKDRKFVTALAAMDQKRIIFAEN